MRRADLRQTLWGGSSQSAVSGIWSPGPGPRKCCQKLALKIHTEGAVPGKTTPNVFTTSIRDGDWEGPNVLNASLRGGELALKVAPQS